MKCLVFMNKEYLSDSNPFKEEHVISISGTAEVEEIWRKRSISGWAEDYIRMSKDIRKTTLTDVVKNICYSKSEVDSEIKKIICLLDKLENGIELNAFTSWCGLGMKDVVLDFSEVCLFRLDDIIEIISMIVGDNDINITLVLDDNKYSIANDFLIQYCLRYQGKKIKSISLGKYAENDKFDSF